MIFVAHIETYDEANNKDITDRIIFTAEDYKDAIDAIFCEYDESDVTRIQLLEPIGYGNIIFMDEEAESRIRHNAYNTF